MNPSEQHLLQQLTGDSAVHARLRTATRIDVGLWWRKRPLWLCLTSDALVLVAAGRRSYAERIAFADCRESFYNPASGELVIAPENPLRFPRLRLPASAALEVIQSILSPSPTPHTPRP